MSEMDSDVVPENGVPMSGNSRIDDALARLERLDELPVDAHPEVFDEIHTGLRDALAHAGRDEDPPTASS